MDFLEDQDGFAPTYTGGLASTVDGGRTWHLKGIIVPGGAQPVTSVRFLNRRDGFAFGPGFFVTHDGGAAWSDQHAVVGELVFDVAPIDQSVWALVQACPHIAYVCELRVRTSADAGRTWGDAAPLPFQGFNARRTRIVRLSPTIADVGPVLQPDGTGPDIAVTHDAGRSWAAIPDPCPSAVSVVEMFAASSPTDAWQVCGGQGATIMEAKQVYRSADGGDHWTLVASVPLTSELPTVGELPVGGGPPEDLVVVSAQRGWLDLGRTGLWTTTDGGHRWKAGFAFSVDAYQGGSVDFLDPNDGWTVAERVVWRTIDGTHWMPLAQPVT